MSTSHTRMQITRKLAADKKLLLVTVTGEITLPAVRADMIQMAAKGNPDPDLPGLIDMRQATASLTADELMQIAEAVKTSPTVVGHTRRALLVGSDLLYGLYRMFASFASGGPTEFRVFRDEHEALAWLGHPVDSEGFESEPA